MGQLVIFLMAAAFCVLCGFAATAVFGTAFAMEIKEWWEHHVTHHHGLMPH